MMDAGVLEMIAPIDSDRIKNFSFDLKDSFSKNQIDVSCLLQHPFHQYFQCKLSDIKRLEDEISIVEKMDVSQYIDYRNNIGNCPLLRTKQQLINNNLYFGAHYQQQIMSIYSRK